MSVVVNKSEIALAIIEDPVDPADVDIDRHMVLVLRGGTRHTFTESYMGSEDFDKLASDIQGYFSEDHDA